MALPLRCHTQFYLKYFYLSLGLLAGSLCELACELVCWPWLIPEEDTESHLFQQLYKLIDLYDHLKLVVNV